MHYKSCQIEYYSLVWHPDYRETKKQPFYLKVELNTDNLELHWTNTENPSYVLDSGAYFPENMFELFTLIKACEVVNKPFLLI